jgi:hypothetical protein
LGANHVLCQFSVMPVLKPIGDVLCPILTLLYWLFKIP